MVPIAKAYSGASQLFFPCATLRALDTVVLLGCFFHRLLEAPARPGLSFAPVRWGVQDVRRPTGGATAGDDRKMNNEPREREPIDRVRARLEALLKANAAPRCGARSKRTGKPCQGAAMPNGRCKFHGGKSTGPRTPEGLERSRRANWKHGHFSREAKAEQSRLRAALLALRDLCDSI
jgi:hypothetical protein